MKMRIFTPAIRISLTLVLFTLSILLVADSIFGLSKEDTNALLEKRKTFSETLAVQSTLFIRGDDESTLTEVINVAVENNPDVLSMAILDKHGRIAVLSGEHFNHWIAIEPNTSTISQIQIPIFDNDTRWGTMQIRFRSATISGALSLLNNAFVKLTIFVALIGFLVYSWFIRKTLHYLDPSSLIPDRVKAALDGLTEGVIMINNKGNIVLANQAFSDKTGIEPYDLIGMDTSLLNWFTPDPKDKPKVFPWSHAIHSQFIQRNCPIKLKHGDGQVISFIVNCSPILDGKGKVKGALASFDDVTALEKTNKELTETVNALEDSQIEVAHQNKRLKEIAARDHLTGCLNRRAFFDSINKVYTDALENGRNISCIMTDIDHFKKFNDTYGHAVGDEVIISVAKKLGNVLRPNDLLCRYGGEEFCIMLMDIDIDLATDIAERMRKIVESQAGDAIRTVEGLKVTMSFGISSTKYGAQDPETIINEADHALYDSKEHGRNQVNIWKPNDPAIRLTAAPH